MYAQVYGLENGHVWEAIKGIFLVLHKIFQRLVQGGPISNFSYEIILNLIPKFDRGL